MKLFLREQSSLILIYVLQLLVTGLVYWLDGLHKLDTAIYAALLSGCILLLYLVYRYLSNRSFYQRLSVPAGSLESYSTGAAAAKQYTPLAEALHQLQKSQFRLYQSELIELKHKNEEHSQFVNQWVHQMKTPISVIHLLIQEEDDSRFRAIGDELDRLRKGLETVLYTSRLDRFEHDLHVEQLQLETVVRNATSSQKRLFIRNSVYPQIDIDKHLTVASDDKWLSFVIAQLITNAVRYSAGKGTKVYFTAYRSGEQTVLEIRDEGIGIPKSDVPKVFDAYFTGENGRRYEESTGMGLYLVRQICEKLGHTAEIDSVAGQGTTVTIRF
ncbi:sensor histidine kinase [Paenibacillus radicis (ex Gao et al. 2016)]|uniref:histidine kinase n=1 Tax=Paenibacillus radicis (ex Gao et al. 2016) TaxID=1737354 RepID=A0A917H856_9BACL|nr:sensor histidine kinase [Paenibacillus radicis (ex Gao et al. 2016)]GGG71073.1 sensor histidine kinase [Paenibacillus radicis (ex Gao et al. 2016)]